MPDPTKKVNPFLEAIQGKAKTTPSPKPDSSPVSTNPFLIAADGERASNVFVDVASSSGYKEKPGTLDRVLTTIAPALDILSRGQYASASFFDGLSDSSKSFLEVVAEASQEIYDPKKRLSFRDLIEKNAPAWVRATPGAASAIGFIADIALDPTSYIGIGLGKQGLKIGSRTLTKAGEELLGDSIRNVSLSAAEGVTRQEIRQTAETLIANATAADPALLNRVFAQDGLRLTVGVPFGKQYDLPGSRQLFRAVGLDAVGQGIRSASNYLRTLPVAGRTIETVAGTFNRFSELPDEYRQAAIQLENEFDFVAGDVIRTTKRYFDNVPLERREEIGSMMSTIDDLSREQEELLGRSLTPTEAQLIRHQEMTARNLSQAERTTVARLYQDYANAAELEMGANLLRHTLTNYSPRYYRSLADPNEITAIHRSKYGLSSSAPSFNARTFDTLEEAQAAGYVPELDAAVLYAQRLVLGRRAMAADNFKNIVRDMYGVESLDRLPERVRNDLKLMGESVYPVYMNSDSRAWLQALDKATSIWKRVATVAKPSFAFKQAVSNTLQLAMTRGISAFKLFDPRSAADAAFLVMERSVAPRTLPQAFQTAVNRSLGVGSSEAVLAQRTAMANYGGLHILEDRLTEAAANFRLTTVFGEQYTGAELVRLARENNIIRGFDSTGERFTTHLRESIGFNDRGRAVTFELMKWWKHAGVVEDYARMMSFINGIRIGNSVPEAVSLTNKALFDYAHGLSSIEKNVIKRVVPFYTFQRFAIPFVLKELVRKPGNIITTDKTFKLFEKLLVSGNGLSEEERSLFGDTFLIEQPRLYKGFDKDGKATFNLLNNLTPIDAISLIKYDKTGEVDLQRTAENTVLASLTPFIKVPVELALDRDFFTNRKVSAGGKLGNLQALDSALPDKVKELIGWETRVNQRDGSIKTYINPFLAHSAMSFFPALRQFINPLDADKSTLAKAQQIIFGLTEVKIDFGQQASIRESKSAQELRELVKTIRSAKIRGAENEFEKAQRELKDLMSAIAESSKLQREASSTETQTTTETKEFK